MNASPSTIERRRATSTRQPWRVVVAVTLVELLSTTEHLADVAAATWIELAARLVTATALWSTWRRALRRVPDVSAPACTAPDWGFPVLAAVAAVDSFHAVEHMVQLAQQLASVPARGIVPSITRWPVEAVHLWCTAICVTGLMIAACLLRPRRGSGAALGERRTEPGQAIRLATLVMALVVTGIVVRRHDAVVAADHAARSARLVPAWPRMVGSLFEVAASPGDIVHHRPDGDNFDWGTGAGFLDIDDDGCVDLYVTDRLGPNRAFHGDCHGGLRELHGTVLEAPGDDSSGIAVADYDNDGDEDVYLLANGPNRLLRNTGGGTFVDVTDAAGVGDPGRGMSAAWGDYDGDGFVDLYVANHVACDGTYWDPACYGPGYPATNRDVLYHNRGDGTFADVTDLLGPHTTEGAGFTVCFTDVDGDHRPDLYVANDVAFLSPDSAIVPSARNSAMALVPPGNVLFHNDGPGADGRWRFSEIAEQVGAALQVSSMGLACGDVDDDGDDDIVVTDIGPAHLLRNDGDHYTEIAGASGLATGFGRIRYAGWGVVMLDVDDDGRLDVYLATSSIEGAHDVLFHNSGGTFEPMLGLEGSGSGAGSRTVATGDIDRDGWQDLFVVTYGGRAVLLHNLARDTANHWLAAHLVGTRSNRDGIGAVVRLRLSDGRTLTRVVRSGDSLGAGSWIGAHFGLGRAAPVALTVTWPSGAVQVVDAPAEDRQLTLVEPAVP